MQILSSASFKTAADTKPGELVVLGHRSRVLAIVLKEERGGRVLGEITATEEPHPRIVYAGPKEECLSYGNDWAIEPLEGDQSFPSLHDNARLAGLIALTAKGWFMSFATSGVDAFGRYTIEWRSLEDFEPAKDVGSAALFSSWQVWASEDAWSDDRDELWSYAAKPPPRLG